MPATRADYAACRALLRDGSRTFHAASFLLPRHVREPACALYAFCRVADDAVDHARDADEALAHLRERLARIYEGRPATFAADRAFADVVARHAIPRELPEALLEGFAWDVACRRYPDLMALEAYAARVAGSVGAMMALLMGANHRDAVARACDLGVAMQLSNIARDVGEDARAGRLYLPLAWLCEAGIDPEAWLARPAHSDALAAVVARLLEAADRLYARARDGVPALPLACRPGISAARFLYAEIGNEVKRRHYDSVTRRAVVSGPRKARVLALALAAAAYAGDAGSAPPLPATRFLVDAVVRTAHRDCDAATEEVQRMAWWNLSARIAWILDLFERLERREEIERAATRG